MVFAYKDEWYPVNEDCAVSEGKLAGCIWLDTLSNNCERYGIPTVLLEMCRSNQLFYRKGMLVTEDYSFCILPIINRESEKEERDRFGVFLNRDKCLLILIEDSRRKTESFFLDVIEKCKNKPSPARVLYCFLDALLESDAMVLENMDFRIARLEEKLVHDKLSRKFYYDILEMKRELLLIRSYYEQLLEISERLHENENKLLDEEERETFLIYKERVKRFRENVTLLKDNLVEVREACESYMDLSTNSIMKIFTVVTTVFMPLTLMTGWYGMNFKYMPELGMKYGYPFFAILSLLVLVGSLVFFKRKKFI